MIRARLENGTFLFGIDDENVRRLKARMPIRVDLKDMGGSDTFLIMYGPTLQDILNDLKAATGQEMPPVSALRPEGDHH